MENTIKPSKYQKKIYTWMKTGKGNAVIQAVAGSGKTTTIVECTKLIPNGKKSIFLAFNSAIQKELNQRLPNNIQSRTLHSLGLSMFMANTNKRPEVENDKLDSVIRQVLKENNIEDRYWGDYFPFLKQMIPKLKATLADYTKYEELEELAIRFNIDNNIDDFKMVLLKGCMEKCKQIVERIDFDDMIWLPIVNNWQTNKFDYVFVDESQDLNKAQFELIKKICNSDTRIIAVGDRCQSIYAFRGADMSSMDNFKKYFKAKEFPLSISYRCPKAVINLAQEIVPDIQCSDTAKEGKVESITQDKINSMAEDGNLILCRTNAPLVSVCFSLIRAGKKATIMGRDIGKNLIKIIDKYTVVNLNDLNVRIMNLRSLHFEKLDMIEQGKYDKKRKNSLMAQVDACDTILALSENVETIDELKSSINRIFTNDRQGIVCSTVHKAKGLEAEIVYIIKFELMPHPMATEPQEIEQEMNIKYVAITRAKKTLYIID